MEPLISVIIPAYNHEKYIKNTIRGVLDQTYRNIELIFINDGSQDATYERALELEHLCSERFSSYKFINQRNQGVGKTLNTGILNSSGTYIATCASDDFYSPNYIEFVMQKFIQADNSFGMATADARFVDKDGNILYFDKNFFGTRNSEKAKYITLQEMTINYDKKNFIEGYGTYEHVVAGKCGFTQGTIFKKNVLIDVGLFVEDNRVEDVDICLKISKKYKSIYIDLPLYNYRIHDNNSVVKYPDFLSIEVLRILENEKKKCEEMYLIKSWKNRVFFELNSTLKGKNYFFVLRYIYENNITIEYLIHIIKSALKRAAKK